MYDLNVLIFDINKTAEDEEQVKTLNNLLSLFGGKAEIKNTFDRNQLVLSYDEEKLKKWKTRNAGRTSNYYNLSVKEVREMINTLGAEQAATKLGMTKQGMYTVLKLIQNDSSHILHQKSQKGSLYTKTSLIY